MDVPQRDVVVIGAGQAGLATGYQLALAGMDFVIVDAGRRIGDGWRKYWDSLRLFTPTRYNNLPGMPFPGDPDGFPHKDQVADYLEAYATRFDLPVRLGVWVSRLRRTERGFLVDTSEGRLRAKVVVVATSSHAIPFVPSLANELDPAIEQLSAMSYRNPDQLPRGDALVVGAGNSGVQIAVELAATRPTWLAGPSTGRIPRRVLHRDVCWWVDKLGVMRKDAGSVVGRTIIARASGRGDPVIGLTSRDIAAAGVRRAPRVVGVDDGRPRLADGRVLSVSTVVWCCGLHPDFGWIDGLSVDARGNPLHRRGRARGLEGLYFMGLRFQNRIGSGLVGGVGRDAEEIVASIRQRLETVSPGASTRVASGSVPSESRSGAGPTSSAAPG